jgi:hypothetical protein
MAPIEISCNGFNVSVTLKMRGVKLRPKGQEVEAKWRRKVPPATLNYNGKLSHSSTPCLNAWSSISIGAQLAIGLVVDLIDAGIVDLIGAGIVDLIGAGIVGQKSLSIVIVMVGYLISLQLHHLYT